MVQFIPISNCDQKAIVSDIDYDLATYNWYLRSNGTVARGIYVKNGNTQILYMHRIIMQRKLQKDLTQFTAVKHYDTNKLNNQRDNLIIEQSYIGVRKSGQHFIAEIEYQNYKYHLGSYNTIVEAAYIYNQKAQLLFGDAALLNDIANINRLPNARFKNKYKGVYYHRQSRKWKAHIGYNNKDNLLGYYATEQQAALAYNQKAIELLGDKAVINLIE